MKRKVIVVLFFIVVFGLPISWYLLLQVFGENQFDLPRMGTLDKSCYVNNEAVAFLLADTTEFYKFPNEAKRIAHQMTKISPLELRLLYFDKCVENEELVLVDEQGEVRGTYMLSRAEVDRLMAEIDVYLMNLNNKRSE